MLAIVTYTAQVSKLSLFIIVYFKAKYNLTRNSAISYIHLAPLPSTYI
jgi:hypothetical protein